MAVRLVPIPVYQKQADILNNAEAFIRAFIGGRGTGKTVVGCVDKFQTAKAGEPHLAVSPDSNVVRETTLPEALAISERSGIYVKHVVSPVPKLWFRTNDGGEATIVFRSAEKPEKLRGGSYASAWIDEATVVSKEAFELIIPTLRFRGRTGNILLTGTPKGTKHWTFEKLFFPAKRELLERYRPGLVRWFGGNPYLPRRRTALVQATSRDNPFVGPDFYQNIRTNYSSMLAQQELEGDFLDVAGLMFKREWFRQVDRVPRDAVRVRYFDRAATPGIVRKTASYTVGLLMAMHEGKFYIEDVIRGQWGPAERDRIIAETIKGDSDKYDHAVLTFVEQEGGSGGKEVAQQLITSMTGHAVFADVVGGKRSRTIGGEELPGEAKVVRAMPFAAAAENGLVYYQRGTWNEDYLQELIAFPEYLFADQVDASSGAFNKLTQNGVIDPGKVGYMSGEANADGFGALAALQKRRLPWE